MSEQSDQQSTEQRSPLAQCVGVDTLQLVNGLHLSEGAFFSHINIRANASDSTIMAALADVVGVPLPVVANRCATSERRCALWLGPDEWLVVSGDQQLANEFSADLTANSALRGQHVALTDLSGGQTLIRLRGVNARAALQRGCPLDLHPGKLGVGACAQTHVNHINVLIWPEQDPDGELDSSLMLNLVVRRSFADYLWRWLQQVQSRLPSNA